jgi:hypothetical protein
MNKGHPVTSFRELRAAPVAHNAVVFISQPLFLECPKQPSLLIQGGFVLDCLEL